MKKQAKSILSLMMIVIMLFTSIPIVGFAVNDEQSGNDITANNSIGEVLASALEEGDGGDDADDAVNYLSSVELDGRYATVKFRTEVYGSIVVAIYDDGGSKMLASGTKEIYPDYDEDDLVIAQTVDVTIDIEAMPETFLLKVFMLGENNYPLCQNLEVRDYTKAYQEFLAQTTDDFEEEKVINFDEDNANNFAVLADGTVTVKADENSNILVSADEETGVYTFSNVTDEIKNLKIGDVFYYENGETAIAIKIGSITADGDKVTITKGDAEVSDIFDYVKINETATASEADFKNAELGEGVTPIDEESGQKRIMKASKADADIDKEVGFSGTYALKYEANNHVDIDGSVKVSLNLKVKIYYDFKLFGKDYIDTEFVSSISAKLTFKVTGKIELDDDKHYLAKVNVPVCGGIIAKAKIAPVFEINAAISGNVSASSKSGYSYCTGVGTKKINEKSSSAKFSAEGKITVKIGLKATIGLSLLESATLEVGTEFGAQAEGKVTFPVFSSGSDVKHDCVSCIDGTISAFIEVYASLKFGWENSKWKWTPVKISVAYTHKINDFYFSINHLDFGFGNCKHKSYKITLTVLNNGAVATGAKVDAVTVDKDGQASNYYKTGSQIIKVNYNGQDKTYNLKVGTKPMSFKVDLRTSNFDLHTEHVDKDRDGKCDDCGAFVRADGTGGKADINISGEMTSGTCGDNLTWVLYNDGELVISGKGAMYDWVMNRRAPWYSYCSSIKKVTIENGVTSIGRYAFYYCTSLASITIPDSVTLISGWAFDRCTSLASITIPNSVTSIGDVAFENCTSLASITIPDSVTSIGEYAFRNCASLASITIPNSVTSIGEYAFYSCESLASITIPDSVTSIGECAFAFCESLASITIPNSVTSIGNYAFYVCKSLASVTIPDSVTSIGNYAFDGCTSLASITIPDSVTSIGGYAFYGCTSLASITIPNSVTSIDWYAFDGCTSLASITIPDSVTSIGYDAFRNCTSLANVTIGNGVKSIGGYAFRGCTSLASVTIPDSVTSIDSQAFYGCTSLENITVDENNKYYSSDTYGVLFNESKTKLIQYPIGNSRMEYTIPNSVTSIGSYAFDDCESLASITIPDSVTSIGNYAFRDCTSLASVTIPDSVTSIGYEAFQNCTSLATVYYTGSQEQWNEISIDSYNDPLKAANIIFNYNGTQTASLANYSLRAATYSDSAEVSEAPINTNSETLESAVAGNSYIMLVVKDANAENLLAPENLLYIDQKTAESETLTFEFEPKEDADYTVLFFGANLHETESHTHNYTAETTEAATCTEDGDIIYTCSCGDIHIEIIPATGHKPVTDKAVAATCTADGYIAYTCSKCGDKYTETITALGHKPVTDKAVAPTCTANGKTDGSHCSVCNEVLVEQKTIIATGHKPVTDKAVAPTCTADGKTDGSHCSVCGEVIVKQNVIPAAGHTDDNNDGKCDICETVICSHICHKSGFAGFIYKIIRIFWKIFGTNKTCACGAAHY